MVTWNEDKLFRMYAVFLNLIGKSFLKFCYYLANEFANKFCARRHAIESEKQRL
jgi:hypothetical protein